MKLLLLLLVVASFGTGCYLTEAHKEASDKVGKVCYFAARMVYVTAAIGDLNVILVTNETTLTVDTKTLKKCNPTN